MNYLKGKAFVEVGNVEGVSLTTRFTKIFDSAKLAIEFMNGFDLDDDGYIIVSNFKSCKTIAMRGLSK